jgi:hypothetical protein
VGRCVHGQEQRFVVRHLKTLSERDRRLEDDITEIRGRLDVVEKEARLKRRTGRLK